MKISQNQIFLLIFILLSLLGSCKKENIITIKPFESISTMHSVNPDKNILLKISLPNYNYSEVGINYSYDKNDLLTSKNTQSKISSKNDVEYAVILNNLDLFKTVYYRVYIEYEDQLILSPIYELVGLQYNLTPKFPNSWIQIQDDSTIEVKLVGENLDTDITKYSSSTPYGTSDLTKIHLEKLKDNKYELTLTFYYGKFIGSTDWGFDLLYDNNKIYTFFTYKIRPNKEYGLYYLNRLSHKSYSNSFNFLFLYNNEFYAIGSDKIEAFDYEKKFWYKVKDIPSNIEFSGSSHFIDNDTLYCTAGRRVYPRVDKTTNKLTLVRFPLNTFEIEFVDFDIINAPKLNSESFSYECEIYKFQNKEYLILYGSIDFELRENYIFEIDKKNRKLNFVMDYAQLNTGIAPKLLSYKNELYILGNDYANSAPHFDVYSLKLYKLDLVKQSVSLVKEYYTEDLSRIAHVFDRNKVWIFGANRSIFSIDFENNFELIKYQHVYTQNKIWASDYIDSNEVEAKLFFRKDMLIFGAGFHTPGLFEIKIENYED